MKNQKTILLILAALFLFSIASASVNAQDDYFYDDYYGDTWEPGIFGGLNAGAFCILPIIVFIIGIVLAIWVYKDAEKRGRNGALWLLIVLITGIIGLIIWLIFRTFPNKKAEQHTQPNPVIQNNTQPYLYQKNQWTEVKNERDDLQERLDTLYQKNQLLNLSEVISLKDHIDSSQRKKAEELLDKMENQYAEYERLHHELKDNKIKTNRLTDRLANGELDSESYKRALDDLDTSRKEKEERLWKLRNTLFKDEYEKPF